MRGQHHHESGGLSVLDEPAVKRGLSVDDYKHDVCAAGDFTIEKDPAIALTRSRRELRDVGLDLHGVSRSDLTAKASAIESAEKRKLASVTIGVGENRVGPHLGDRLAHQNTGQGRAARKMTRKPELIAGQSPGRSTVLTRTQFEDLIEEQKRWPMRQNL